MTTATEIEYGAKVRSFAQGEFSTEYVIRIMAYEQSQLKEQQFAVSKDDLDNKRGLVKLVFANKKGKIATIGVNIAGCGGLEWLDIPIEDLVEL